MKLIVALDLDNLKQVEQLVQKLGNSVNFYKVGLKLYTRYGPDILKLLKKKQKQIFLDLKFHDIPNTVAEACREATKLKVNMLTIHASGGLEMMQAAAQAVRQEAKRLKISKPLVMGVTVLTSMDSLVELGIPRSPKSQVLHLAKLAVQAKLDGVISSPHELQALREIVPPKFKIVTPGIRPLGSAKGDQKRVMTPAQAFKLGADAIVVGRPIWQAREPQQVVQKIQSTY